MALSVMEKFLSTTCDNLDETIRVDVLGMMNNTSSENLFQNERHDVDGKRWQKLDGDEKSLRALMAQPTG
jgi:hypothetical protein